MVTLKGSEVARVLTTNREIARLFAVGCSEEKSGVDPHRLRRTGNGFVRPVPPFDILPACAGHGEPTPLYVHRSGKPD